MQTPSSEPDIYNVRIIREAKQLSRPIVLVLPGMPKPDPTKYDPRSLFLDVSPPDMDPYHVSLGRFMNDWGRLESSMHHLFARLFGSEKDKCNAISRSFSGKSLRDLLENLSATACSPGSHKKLVKLLERFSKVNTKRNKIVHGNWVIEVMLLDGDNGSTQIRVDTYRETAGLNREVYDAMQNIKSQRIRAANLFNIDAINAVARDTKALAADFHEFTPATSPQKVAINSSLAPSSNVVIDNPPDRPSPTQS